MRTSVLDEGCVALLLEALTFLADVLRCDIIGRR
jgi:hypothetical protein